MNVIGTKLVFTVGLEAPKNEVLDGLMNSFFGSMLHLSATNGMKALESWLNRRARQRNATLEHMQELEKEVLELRRQAGGPHAPDRMAATPKAPEKFEVQGMFLVAFTHGVPFKVAVVDTIAGVPIWHVLEGCAPLLQAAQRAGMQIPDPPKAATEQPPQTAAPADPTAAPTNNTSQGA